MGLSITFTVEDFFATASSAVVKSISYADLLSYLTFEDIIPLSDLPYVVLALDNHGQHPSIHSYPFITSFCEIANKLYATTSEGVCQITGATDDGEEITTGLVFKTDFDLTHMKKLRALILSGDVIDTSITVSADTMEAQTFTMTGNRCYVARNLYGQNWDLRLTNFDALSFFDIIPVVMGRR